VNRNFGQTAFDHQSLEQPRPAPEAVAVRHQHGDQADAARVSEDGDQLFDRQERRFAVRNLRVAFRAEPRAQPIELAIGVVDRDRCDVIRVFAEVAAGAREVAAGMQTNRRAAAGRLPSESLSRRSQFGIERVPARAHQALLFGSDRMPEQR
jgi:hypothetical protein